MPDRDIKLDLERHSRIGFDEAIFCAGKSSDQLTAILDQADGATLLLTRLEQTALDALPDHHRTTLNYEPVSRTAFFGNITPAQGASRTAVITAGTSDTPASREAARTLRYYGYSCTEITDIGVAGLWRLTERVEEIRTYPVVIVAAGLDAALASVLGGLVPGVVIGLPTSTGYGVAEGGMTALRSMLVSCAPGITVVNIDNGYGAACAAIRVLGAST
ncbi:MAG: nickel pincer cofactor biosynthesis protein LarB [Alphaproteobacteria bacterium]|jgi:hypothetical protein|nr:nickel pincer cofactor biosynthesis protein LarB [Alphaproteobacteria bacterium]